MVPWLTKSQVVRLLRGPRPEEYYLEDNESFFWGTGRDAQIYFDGTDWLFVSTTGQLILNPNNEVIVPRDLWVTTGSEFRIYDPTDSLYIYAFHDGSNFYFSGSPGSGNFYFRPAGAVDVTDIWTADIMTKETGSATAASPGFPSFLIETRGSGWDGAAARPVAFTARTDVTDATNYRYVIRSTYPSAMEIFRLTNDGDAWIRKDIEADGGFKNSFNFQQIDVAAGQTSVAIDVLGLAGNTEYTLPYDGSIVAISIASNAARTGGTLTVKPTVNGVEQTLAATLDATNTTYHYATQAKDAETFSAGDRLGVKITTDATWAPTTADIVVTVVIEF